MKNRIAYSKFHGNDCITLCIRTVEKYHFLGRFPDAVLSDSNETGKYWLDNFIRIYTERDMPLYGLTADPITSRRLWEMLAWVNQSKLVSENGYLRQKTKAGFVNQMTDFHIMNLKKPSSLSASS